MAKFTISLDKIIDEFKLETIYTPKNASEIEIDEADVTRPGLQLMGFYEYFNPERIQIIGKMEYAYLSTIDEETRVQRLDMLFSQRIPALVISRELPYFEEMLDLAKKYSVPLLRSKESTSNFIAGLIAFLNLNLAPRITRHGVLIEIYGEGVFITGESGTRMAYQVLSMSDADAAALAEAIQNAHTRLHRCRVCQNYTEAELCPICSSAKRDRSTICVVETPRDVQAFERTREYHGLYHVLHGLISPMDGIGAEQLSVKELLARLGSGEVKEVIMAMNPTVEGEATAMYLAKLIKPLGIKTTRLAYGLPVGGSLEYTDETTLYRALSGRDEL